MSGEKKTHLLQGATGSLGFRAVACVAFGVIIGLVGGGSGVDDISISLDREVTSLGVPEQVESTPCFNAMSTALEKLQNYDIQCPDNHVLRSFHLNNQGCNEPEKKYKYTYECVRVLQGLSTPVVMDQDWESASDLNSLTKVASNVACKGSSVLTGFQLQQAGDKLRYELRCAELGGDQDFPRKLSVTKETLLRSVSRVKDLKEHDVKCPPAQAMRGFSVKPGQSKVKYKYTCISIPTPPSPPPPSPPPSPPYALHVASVDLRTSRKDKIMSDNYASEAHEFHRCMTENNTIFEEDWTSDGEASSKLADMKGAILLDPIGKLRENGVEMKVYNATYELDLVDHDGHKPIQAMLRDMKRIKAEAESMCVNPLDDIVAQGLLSETSKACEDQLMTQSGLVNSQYKTCNLLVDNTLDKLNDLSQWKTSTFSLKTDAAKVDRLYKARKKAGEKYDKYFNVWLSTHNDGLAACAYSTNYMKFYEDLSAGYLTDLNKEKEDITDHCTDIPTMQTFDVSKANVDTQQVGSAASRLGAQLDSDNPCYAAVEAINGIKMQAESTHSKRAQCLEYYCETIHDDHLPSARANAETAQAEYNKLDEEFNQAYLKYTYDEKSYQDYYDKVIENLDLVEEARDLAEGSMNTTKTLKEALLVTAACEPSSICCQKAEEIPEICHRNANGTVATFVTATGLKDVDINNYKVAKAVTNAVTKAVTKA